MLFSFTMYIYYLSVFFKTLLMNKHRCTHMLSEWAEGLKEPREKPSCKSEKEEAGEGNLTVKNHAGIFRS